MCLWRSYLPGFSRLAILVATLHELFGAFRRGFPDPGRSSVACATWRLDDFHSHEDRIYKVRDLLRESWFNTKCWSWVINLTNQRHLLRWSRWGRRPIWSERETLQRVKRFCSVLGGENDSCCHDSKKEFQFWTTVALQSPGFSEQNWCCQLLAVSTMTTVATTKKKKKNYKKSSKKNTMQQGRRRYGGTRLWRGLQFDKCPFWSTDFCSNEGLQVWISDSTQSWSTPLPVRSNILVQRINLKDNGPESPLPKTFFRVILPHLHHEVAHWRRKKKAARYLLIYKVNTIIFFRGSCKQ